MSIWRGFDLDSPVCVLHHCDNPACFNPDHLFLGTRADNNRDMKQKGRARGAAPSGSRNGQSKLLPEQVLDILARLNAGETQGSVASVYGIAQSAVSSIARGRTWGYLTMRKEAA